MKFQLFFFYYIRTNLYLAINKNNLEMVKLLISKKGIDLNAYSILNDEIYKNI